MPRAHFFSLNSFLLLCCNLRLSLQIDHFLRGFQTNFALHLYVSHACYIPRSPHPLDLIIKEAEMILNEPLLSLCFLCAPRLLIDQSVHQGQFKVFVPRLYEAFSE